MPKNYPTMQSAVDASGKSHLEIALACGLKCTNTLKNWMNGETRPDIVEAELLAVLLGVDLKTVAEWFAVS